MFERHLRPSLLEALADRPVVTLVGPRQAGKSTLARGLVDAGVLHRYLTMDDASVLAAARSDPDGFVAALPDGVVLDEVQRAPELALAIKASVDRDRRAGRFLLTGSADVMVLPGLADALVGRMEVLALRPLSQGEIDGARDGFIDWAFSDQEPADPTVNGSLPIEERMVRGGFPEPLAMSARRREAWFGAYVTSVVQRDIRDLARIAGASELPRLLTMLAARTATTLNMAELSRTAGIPQTTLGRYLALLEGSFLIQSVSAWTGDAGRRSARSPKVHVSDCGLAAWLTGADRSRLERDRDRLGPLLESFAVTEIQKQLGWSRTGARMTHYRSHDGREVDLILEDRDGTLVGIEVKATTAVRTGDLRGLRALQDRAGDRFRRGVLLHLGRQVVPFGPRLHALPIESLWSGPAWS